MAWRSCERSLVRLGSRPWICHGRMGQGCGARTTSRRMCLCSRTLRQRRVYLRRRGLGRNQNIRAFRPDRLKADGSNRAEVGRTPAMVTPLSKAVQRLGSQASMVACRLEDRQKFQRTSRLPISFAMSSQSWRQGGWRELWLALLSDLRESSLPLWMQRQKRPHGFTINIRISKPTSMAQNRSTKFKEMLESPRKGMKSIISWSKRPPPARAIRARTSIRRTI